MGENEGDMNPIEELTNQLLEFRKARDWEQFHNPKDVALSLVLEATEVMEHFQWKNPEQVREYAKTHKQEIGEELADVFYWVLLLSHDLGIDPVEALKNKMEENEKKYPVDKARGVATKYTNL